MPKIIEWKGYKFFFFSNEGIPFEPIHIHIRKGKKLLKLWIEQEVSIANSFGMSSIEIIKLKKIVIRNQDLIRRIWNEYFSE